MRGVILDDIPRMMTEDIFDKVLSYSEDGRFDTLMMFEFIPHGKINGVPAHETPYCRHLPGNALSLVQWNENTPENTAGGLDIVTKMADLIKVSGEAYGNYSECILLPIVQNNSMTREFSQVPTLTPSRL